MKYGTAPAFRRALEDRLKVRASGDGARIARDRKRVVFDRFLARLVNVAPDEWVLKGGFALDLRIEDRARSTKDIDLAWRTDEDELLDTLIDVSTEDVFDTRATHEPPQALPAPPAPWRVPFGQLAQAVGLDRNIDVGHSTVAAMLDPILNHQIQTGTWSPDAQQWVNVAKP